MVVLLPLDFSHQHHFALGGEHYTQFPGRQREDWGSQQSVQGPSTYLAMVLLCCVISHETQ